jgi:hypothetical protein
VPCGQSEPRFHAIQTSLFTSLATLETAQLRFSSGQDLTWNSDRSATLRIFFLVNIFRFESDNTLFVVYGQTFLGISLSWIFLTLPISYQISESVSVTLSRCSETACRSISSIPFFHCRLAAHSPIRCITSSRRSIICYSVNHGFSRLLQRRQPTAPLRSSSTLIALLPKSRYSFAAANTSAALRAKFLQPKLRSRQLHLPCRLYHTHCSDQADTILT